MQLRSQVPSHAISSVKFRAVGVDTPFFPSLKNNNNIYIYIYIQNTKKGKKTKENQKK